MPESSMGATPPAAASGRRELAAVWFADIVGFTSLSAAREDEALRLVGVFQAAARETVGGHGGRLIKFLGDGALAVFQSAEAAVRSALDLTALVSERTAGAGEVLRVRVGIHVGDVTAAADGDVYGDGVNVASRIASVARPGEVLASEDVWRMARRRSDLAFEPRGERRLKGLEEPIRLYTVRAGESGAAAPSRSWRSRPHLVGRRVAAGSLALLVVVAAVILALRGDAEGSLIADGELERDAAILLADLTSQAGDSSLARAATEALRVDLSQSPAFSLVAPERVRGALDRMERDSVHHLGLELAREVAIREGIPALLVGDVGRIGGGFSVSSRLVRASSGEVLAAARSTATDSTRLLDAIEHVSRDLRARIGESFRSIEASPALEQVTTPSLSALQRFTEAERAMHREADYVRAIELYEEALAIDPNFAMAYRGLGRALGNSGIDPARAMQALTSAYEHRDRLTDLERLAATGMYHFRRGEWEAAMAAYRMLVDRRPTDSDAINNLANVYVGTRNFAAAEQLYERAIEVDSLGSYIPYWNLHIAEIAQGELDEARGTIELIGRRFPGHPAVPTAMVGYETARGRYDAAIEHLEKLLAERAASPFWRFASHKMAAPVHAVRGQLAAAEQQWEEAGSAADEMGQPAERLKAVIELAGIDALVRNDGRRAVARVEAALREDPIDRLPPLNRPHLELAWLYAVSGQADRARASIAAHRAARPHELWRATAQQEALVRAAIDLAEDNADGAVAAARAADRGPCSFCALPWLGRAFDMLGQPDSAARAYQRYLSVPSAERVTRWPEAPFTGSSDAYWLGTTLERLGEIHAERGDRDQAAEYYRRLASLWHDADPELQPRSTAAERRVRELTGALR